MGQEIAQAITSSPIGETVDQDDLEQELGQMEQEALDERMTNTGTVPVADRLPSVGNGERTSLRCALQPITPLTRYTSSVRAPNTKAAAREEEDEEAELAKLQAEMAM